MSFEEKLRKGEHWEGFLGGSFNHTLRLAQIIASRKSQHYHTRIVKIRHKDPWGKWEILYGVALKDKAHWS